MDPKYGEVYRELFEKHWWWRARTELIVETVRRLQPPEGWQHILDVGCGDALFFDRLTQFGNVEGVEPCPELVAPENPYRDKIYTCPFDSRFNPGKQYSLVLMLDVLEHLDDPLDALRHVSRLLLPAGTLIITVPAFLALWTNHDVVNHHKVRYTKTTLHRVMTQAGLHAIDERYLYHWTCPLKLASRVMETIFQMRPKPAKVPVSLVNEVLFWLSRLEQKTLSVLPMPFGSSLLLVARHGARS